MLQDANAVRLGSDSDDVLVYFPEPRILRHRTPGDEVAVTHAGQTTIYASPAHLAAEMRLRDPKAAERECEHDQIRARLAVQAEQAAARERQTRALQTRAERLAAEASSLIDEAAAIRDAARRHVRNLKIAAAAGVLLALLACACGL